MRPRPATALSPGPGLTPADSRVDHGSVVDQPERWRSPFTQVELRSMWTYSDGVADGQGVLVAGRRRRGRKLGAGGPGDRERRGRRSGRGVLPSVPAGGRIRRRAGFSDLPGDGHRVRWFRAGRSGSRSQPLHAGNGPQRAARPHVLMVPRRHRDGWSSATPAELAACQAAMTLVAAWYRSLDGGHVVFCANDSPPNVDYQRDVEGAGRSPAGREADAATTRNPGRRFSTLICTPSTRKRARPRTTSRRRSPGTPSSPGVARRSRHALGGDAVTGRRGHLDDRRRHPRGRDGPGAAVTARTSWAWTARSGSCPPWERPRTSSTGASPGPTDSRRSPTRRLGGAVNLVRPGLADAGRLAAARRATAQQRAGFEAFRGPARTQCEVAAVLVR